MGQFFAHRRVVAIVVSLLILIAGAGALRTLPVAMFPDVAPPTVAINAVYPGANALTVEQSVAANIERALTGVDGLLYTSSQSANDGSYSLTATFASGTDVDVAATNVQNKVNAVVNSLPAEVARAGVTVSKSATDTLLALAIYSPQSSYDELFISNYVTINVIDRIARLEGVGGTQIAGQRDYSMRIWLRPRPARPI